MPQESKTTKISDEARELAAELMAVVDTWPDTWKSQFAGIIQRALDARPQPATPESRDFTIPCQIRVLATFDKGVKVSIVQGAIDRLRAASAEQAKTIARLREALTKIANPMAGEGDTELNYTRRSIAYQALAATTQTGDAK